MLETFAKAIVYTLAVYASLGLVFALPFVWLGVQRLDSEAQGSGIGFRLLILPGEAQLVGAFKAGKAFLLPLNEKSAGHLVLFSQAHQNVFDTARVEKLP